MNITIHCFLDKGYFTEIVIPIPFYVVLYEKFVGKDKQTQESECEKLEPEADVGYKSLALC